MEPPILRGKLVVVALFGVAAVMSTGAWIYHYQSGRRSAQFWGQTRGRLLIGAPKVALHRLTANDSPAAGAAAQGEEVRERPVSSLPIPLPNFAIEKSIDLSLAPGLVHFRHALTQDANYLWDKLTREEADLRRWQWAIEFTGRQADEKLWVLLADDASVLGKPEGDPLQVDAIPCPRMAATLQAYLLSQWNER